MKIPINLASRPFRKDRAMVVASLGVCVVLLGTLGMLISLALADRDQYADLRGEINRLNRRIRTVQTDQATLDAVLHKEENAEVLVGSLFLNSLLKRKGISWTRIFADLEEIVPYDVKVLQIRPTVSGQVVSLDLLLGSETPPPLIELLRKFGESPIFSNPDPKTMQSPSQSEPLYRFRLSVDYAQKL